MTTVIIVHPGSVFLSYAEQAERERVREVTQGMLDRMLSASSLIIIDGSFSDRAFPVFNRMAAFNLERITQEGGLSVRAWGCDSGEAPYPGWVGNEGMIFGGQEEAASALAERIDPDTEIVVTGAWATRDGRGGCVNSVVDALLATDRLRRARILIPEDAAYEEDLTDEPGP